MLSSPSLGLKSSEATASTACLNSSFNPMIHSVSRLSTSVAPHPPNVVVDLPEMGCSSSFLHACSLYDFQHLVNASFTAACLLFRICVP